MPLGRKVDGGSNYKCSNFEDRERRLERITMNITLGPCVKVPNENRKIFMISLGLPTKDKTRQEPKTRAGPGQNHLTKHDNDKESLTTLQLQRHTQELL